MSKVTQSVLSPYIAKIVGVANTESAESRLCDELFRTTLEDPDWVDVPSLEQKHLVAKKAKGYAIRLPTVLKANTTDDIALDKIKAPVKKKVRQSDERGVKRWYTLIVLNYNSGSGSQLVRKRVYTRILPGGYKSKALLKSDYDFAFEKFGLLQKRN